MSIAAILLALVSQTVASTDADQSSASVTWEVPDTLPSLSEEECLKLHPEISSPVEMARCTSRADEADQAIKEAFETLAGSRTALKRRELNAAQSAWVSYRDATCRYQATGMPGSTAHASDIVACIAASNIERATQLGAERQAELLLEEAERLVAELGAGSP